MRYMRVLKCFRNKTIDIHSINKQAEAVDGGIISRKHTAISFIQQQDVRVSTQ